MIDICFKSLHPRVVLTTSITSNTTTTITIMGGGVLMTQIFRDQQREREREERRPQLVRKKPHGQGDSQSPRNHR